jgi:hypothetical protein
MLRRDSLQTYFLLNTSKRANRNEDIINRRVLESKLMSVGFSIIHIPMKPTKVVNQRSLLTVSFNRKMERISVKRGME